MATVNQIGLGLSGASGTGSFAGTTSTNLVFSTSPTLVTPTIGAASATSITFSSTTGVVGTTTNNDAAAGSVGEFVTAGVVEGSAVGLSTGITSNVTSISLTAGDWDVWGTIGFTGGATTTLRYGIGCITTTSGGVTASNLRASIPFGSGISPFAVDSVAIVAAIASQRFSLSGTTTIYITGSAGFSVSTCSAFGTISARRRR